MLGRVGGRGMDIDQSCSLARISDSSSDDSASFEGAYRAASKPDAKSANPFSASRRPVTLERRPLPQPICEGMLGISKRGLDIVFSILILLFGLPLLIAIAIAVRLDSPGPSLFRQQRCGLNRKPFTIYKFRTMTVRKENGPTLQAVRNDQRCTRLGRFLRQTSLDELPQFLNVLLGDMSVVGPRPHATMHDDAFSARMADYKLRYRCRPGITGLAQIRGARGEIKRQSDLRRRVSSDLEYQQRWSLWFDLWLIAMTPIVMIGHLATNRAY